jgi:hypothetical protein
MLEAPIAPASGTTHLDRQLIFMGGCPRSGMTVLRRLLAMHSRIHCGPDTGLPPSLAMQWNAFAANLGDLHQKDFDLDRERVRVNMAELLTGLIATPIKDAPHKRLIEKTSLNVIAFTALAELMPRARFVHVVRDGRDVAASLLQRDWRDPQGLRFAHTADPAAALKYWTDLTGLGLQAEHALGPRRILRIRYEDLVRKPKRTLKTLLEFIDLGFEKQMFNYPGQPIQLEGMEKDSLPLLNAPLNATRIGAGAALSGLASGKADTMQRLGQLGYG